MFVFLHLVCILKALQSCLDALLQLIGVPTQVTNFSPRRFNLQNLRQEFYFLCHGFKVSVELSGLTEHSLSAEKQWSVKDLSEHFLTFDHLRSPGTFGSAPAGEQRSSR